MFSSMFSGLPSDLSCSLAISISFSITSFDTPFSSRAIGFIAAACIAIFLATSPHPSKLSDKPTSVAILLPAWIYDPTKFDLIFTKLPISIFSPITPVCSVNYSLTDILSSKSELKSWSIESQPKAISEISFARVTKDSFLPTKSVSQLRDIITPLSFLLFTVATF